MTTLTETKVSSSRNADKNTPKGAYAEIATDGVKLGSEVGYWTKVGTGARVGANSPLGNWSEIGPYAQIGDDVEFGAWACVGIDAYVSSGAELGSHEYVPSGHMRLANGDTHNQVEPSDPETRRLYRAFDAYQTAIPAGVYSHEEYARLKAQEDHWRSEVARLLPAFLARRKASPLPLLPAKAKLTIKLPYWLKGPPPERPTRGISGDLALAFGNRLTDASQRPMSDRAQSYMGDAIQAAAQQERHQHGSWEIKLRAYKRPLEVPLSQFVAWTTAGAALALLLFAMWNA